MSIADMDQRGRSLTSLGAQSGRGLQVVALIHAAFESFAAFVRN